MLRGGDGRDHVVGGDGRDVLFGGDGNDSMAGDVRAMQPKDEWDPGDDRIDGGEGSDWVGFDPHPRVEVDLTKQTSWSHGAGSDALRSIENASGSNDDDLLVGNAEANVLDGGYGGNDRLVGRGGDDRLDGGDGSDDLEGGPGDDELKPMWAGSAEGSDLADGGDGIDLVSFELEFFDRDAAGDECAYDWTGHAGVAIDLGSGTASQPDGTTDWYRTELTAIEDAAGTEFEDVINGDDGPNSLYGRCASDRIDGRNGVDYIHGGAETDVCLSGEEQESCEA